MRVNIIGGGIAGCALAYMIAREGREPVIYEAGSYWYDEAEAPEHDCSTYNPRYSAQWDENAKYFSLGYFEALRLFDEFTKEGVDFRWDQCGTLQLLANEKKARRYPKMVESWGEYGWGEDDLRMVSAAEGSEIAGVKIEKEGIYLGRAGVISPYRICARLVKGIEVNLNASVKDLSVLPGDVTVLACGAHVSGFEEAAFLPMQSVRGQVTYLKETVKSSKIKTTVNYGGHISPSLRGVQYIGATFQPRLTHTNIMPEDDEENIQKLCERFPALDGTYSVVASKAGVRSAVYDHFPVIGQLSSQIYVSTAHGSHGFVSALSSAIILANKIVHNKGVISDDVLKQMSPARFV